jgi:ABC-type branched-subunit amino acid transport system substrate-binding protein
MRPVRPLEAPRAAMASVALFLAAGPPAWQSELATSRREHLTSPECRLLADPEDLTNDNTVWVGLVTDVSRRPIRELSADEARLELATVARGLPPTRPGGPRRPFALISCDSARPIGAIFEHLIGKLGLPAVIGPEYSGEVLQAMTRFTVPAGSVLLTVASATSLTARPTEGLFFRTWARDSVQGEAQASLVSRIVEPELRASGALGAGEPMKVFFAHKGDEYGQGIAATLATRLRFNGKSARDNGPNFRRVAYGNRDDPSSSGLAATYANAAAGILAMQPHVVILAGTTEAEAILTAVESGWPRAGPPRPRWLVTDGVQSTLARVASPDPGFARRVLATGPRVDFGSKIARRWLATLSERHPETFAKDPRSANALAIYDLVYATAYAVAAVGSEPLTGRAIGKALRELNRRGAPEVPVGPDGILDALARIGRGHPLDLRGASGSLDWDEKGDVVADVDILCLTTTGAGGAGAAVTGLRPSGLYFDPAQGTLAGQWSGECGR